MDYVGNPMLGGALGSHPEFLNHQAAQDFVLGGG